MTIDFETGREMAPEDYETEMTPAEIRAELKKELAALKTKRADLAELIRDEPSFKADFIRVQLRIQEIAAALKS